MNKLILSTLMGVGLLTSVQVSAQESAVNQRIQESCSSAQLYNQYVCNSTEGVLAKLGKYDNDFRPPEAYLKPSVDGDTSGGSTSSSSSSTGGSSGGSTITEDFYDDGFGQGMQ